MLRIKYILRLFGNIGKFPVDIILGKYKALDIDTNNIEYIYYVFDKEDTDDIISDNYIKVSKYSTNALAGITSPYILYGFKEYPTKKQYEISKGTIIKDKAIIKFKYSSDKYPNIFTRKIDDAILIPIQEDKFYLNDLEYTILDFE